jgi:small subunit ribosomal protein S16
MLAGRADEAPAEKADKAEKPADVPASETPEGAAAEAEAAEGTEKSGS